MTPTLLEVTDLEVSYGATQAVRSVSFNLKQGEIVTLIGANGAGKSSILRAISGLEPYEGTIAFRGQSLKTLKTPDRIRQGISHVPEGRGIFPLLTVEENVQLGTIPRKHRSSLAQDEQWIFGLFPRLAERRRQIAGTLSGGEQQMLAIGRALMMKPELLLLDEPSLGLAPKIIEQIFTTLRTINDQGTSILLVEQNAYMALNLADRALVLELGKVSLAGSAQEIRHEKGLKNAWLGI
jgi:branched-chain amino acid transport system ATP-binding protein